ncbi:MAG: MFS transporter [Candidatus Dormibacteria bacterium]
MTTSDVTLRSSLIRMYIIQGGRAFVYGCTSILYGAAFAQQHFPSWLVGLLFTLMLLGMGGMNLLAGRLERWIPRRLLYSTYLGILAVAGLLVGIVPNPWVIGILALLGVLSTDANDSGPLTTLEQSMIAEVPTAARVGLYSMYNAIAYGSGAIGAGCAALIGLLETTHVVHVPYARWLLILCGFGIVAFFIARGIDPLCDGSRSSDSLRGVRESKKNVRTIAALFALDAFGGGFIAQSFLVYWFTVRFGIHIDVMGVVILIAGGLQAFSAWAAGWLGSRFGLLNTMVFSHIPSNIFLLGIAVAPSFPIALVLLLARYALSQMDVPTRQAYVAALVTPQERTAANAMTNTARYAVRPVGPVVSGAVLHLIPGAPFFFSGGIKLLYDVVIYGVFRKVPLREEHGQGGTE